MASFRAGSTRKTQKPEAAEPKALKMLKLVTTTVHVKVQPEDNHGHCRKLVVDKPGEQSETLTFSKLVDSLGRGHGGKRYCSASPPRQHPLPMTTAVRYVHTIAIVYRLGFRRNLRNRIVLCLHAPCGRFVPDSYSSLPMLPHGKSKAPAKLNTRYTGTQTNKRTKNDAYLSFYVLLGQDV